MSEYEIPKEFIDLLDAAKRFHTEIKSFVLYSKDFDEFRAAIKAAEKLVKPHLAQRKTPAATSNRGGQRTKAKKQD